MQSAESFETIYREHYKQVYLYIRRHVSNEADAEDLTAVVFAQTWKAWESYDPDRCPIRAWLYIIAGNLLKNYYRDAKSTLSLDDESLAGTNAGLAELQCDSIRDTQELMELREQLVGTLKVLDERERVIIVNKYFFDMKNRELADRLGISEGNVRVISTRALKKMQEYLKRETA